MTVPRISPEMGSFACQLDALDRGLLETAAEVGTLKAENRRLRERVVELAAQVAGFKVALQSAGMAPVPVPAAGERRLRLVGGSR